MLHGPDSSLRMLSRSRQATDDLGLELILTHRTDECHLDQPHPWHVAPGAGFTSVFAVNLDF